MDSQKRQQSKEKKAGVYTTIAFHLGVLIVLLLLSIGAVSRRENTFVLDFTSQENLEREQQQMQIREEVSKALDEQIGASRQSIRNIRVDAGAQLKDDRYKDPSSIYKEADELQRKLDAAKAEAMREEEKAEDRVDLDNKDTEPSKDAPAYRGPSVLSYTLEGRKARTLPVPAYKGFAGGDVYVAIEVNRSGRIISAKVIPGASSTDPQLQEYAVEAAMRSRFSAKNTAPEPQSGEIVYRFVAQ